MLSKFHCQFYSALLLGLICINSNAQLESSADRKPETASLAGKKNSG